MKITIKNVKIRTVGNKELPSYVIPIPKHKISEGLIDPTKEYDVILEEVN